MHFNASKPEKEKKTKEEYLEAHGLKTLCRDTVRQWMNDFGYRYLHRKKGYYNDKHEDPANVLYCIDFIGRYKEYELRAQRWIQISLEEATSLIHVGTVIEGDGYHYQDENGNFMVEFHVDCAECFHDRMNADPSTPFGGKLSVRFPKDKKPLMIFGQDECIFKQYIFTRKHWQGRNGEVPLIPKDDGAGITLSAFQSREYSFSVELSDRFGEGECVSPRQEL